MVSSIGRGSGKSACLQQCPVHRLSTSRRNGLRFTLKDAILSSVSDVPCMLSNKYNNTSRKTTEASYPSFPKDVWRWGSAHTLRNPMTRTPDETPNTIIIRPGNSRFGTAKTRSRRQSHPEALPVRMPCCPERSQMTLQI